MLDVSTRGEGPEPSCRRNAGVLFGLSNIVDNAADFAAERVIVEARWSPERVAIEIRDDGPGIAPEVLLRVGEPYVTTRGSRPAGEAGAAGSGSGCSSPRRSSNAPAPR